MPTSYLQQRLSSLAVSQPAPWRGLFRLLRVMLDDFSRGGLSLRALSLAYTTLLSVVPFLAVSFSVLKAFGAHNSIEPWLIESLVPLGETGEVIGAQLIRFVENTQVAMLGTLGMLLLVYTSFTLLQKTEDSFDDIWRVARPRSLAARFRNYLAGLVLVPLLLMLATGLAGWVLTLQPEGFWMPPFLTTLLALSDWVPSFLLLIIGFTLIYWALPNCRVQFRHALLGGVLAASLWQVTGWGFSTFMAGSTHLTAIYSGFAIPMLFMVWVHLAWLILLAGATLTHYLQHPERLRSGRQPLTGGCGSQTHLLLAVASAIARRHHEEGPPWDGVSLAQALGQPVSAVQATLGQLVAGGFLYALGAAPHRYLLARAPEVIPVQALLDLVWKGEGDEGDSQDSRPASGAIDALLRQLHAVQAQAIEGLSLKDLDSGGVLRTPGSIG